MIILRNKSFSIDPPPMDPSMLVLLFYLAFTLYHPLIISLNISLFQILILRDELLFSYSYFFYNHTLCLKYKTIDAPPIHLLYRNAIYNVGSSKAGGALLWLPFFESVFLPLIE